MMAGTAVAGDYRPAAGSYRDYLQRLHSLSGRAGRPIVIEAANPAEPPRFIARPGTSMVSLADVRHLVVHPLELDAVKAEGHSRDADFITLENRHAHDHAASQQNVGGLTKCPAFGWMIRANRIRDVGTGMCLGDSDGSDPFVAGLNEGNRIVRTRGYNLQAKHQTSRPAAYAGRYDMGIRFNVFSKQGAVPGPQARSNVLLGHLPLAGAGSVGRHLVYGNLFLLNPSEALLQAEGRGAVYDDVFINGSGDTTRIRQHNDVPRDMDRFSNTVLASGVGAGVRRAAGTPCHQRVTANVATATPIAVLAPTLPRMLGAFRP